MKPVADSVARCNHGSRCLLGPRRARRLAIYLCTAFTALLLSAAPLVGPHAQSLSVPERISGHQILEKSAAVRERYELAQSEYAHARSFILDAQRESTDLHNSLLPLIGQDVSVWDASHPVVTLDDIDRWFDSSSYSAALDSVDKSFSDLKDWVTGDHSDQESTYILQIESFIIDVRNQQDGVTNEQWREYAGEVNLKMLILGQEASQHPKSADVQPELNQWWEQNRDIAPGDVTPEQLMRIVAEDQHVCDKADKADADYLETVAKRMSQMAQHLAGIRRRLDEKHRELADFQPTDADARLLFQGQVSWLGPLSINNPDPIPTEQWVIIRSSFELREAKGIAPLRLRPALATTPDPYIGRGVYCDHDWYDALPVDIPERYPGVEIWLPDDRRAGKITIGIDLNAIPEGELTAAAQDKVIDGSASGAGSTERP